MSKPKYIEWLEPEKLVLIEGWARDGLNNEQIAHNMGISEATLYNYKNSQIEILEALKRGKEVIDRFVENALLKRAMGYNYTEITKENGKIIKEVIKEVVPDVTAQIIWLKNRKPAQWRDKQEIEHSGDMSLTVKWEK